MTIRYELHAPLLTGRADDMAQALGGAVWLWMQTPGLGNITLAGLKRHLHAPMQKGLYAMATRHIGPDRHEPAALLIYARFDAEAERRHMADPKAPIPDEHWLSGDRLWLISWVAPFGGTLAMNATLRRAFGDQTARSLSHHSARLGQRIIHWRGARCGKQAMTQWWQSRPIIVSRTRNNET